MVSLKVLGVLLAAVTLAVQAVPFALMYEVKCTIMPTTYNCSGKAPPMDLRTQISLDGSVKFSTKKLDGPASTWVFAGTYDESGGSGNETGVLSFGLHDKDNQLFFNGVAYRTFRGNAVETLSAWMNISGNYFLRCDLLC